MKLKVHGDSVCARPILSPLGSLRRSCQDGHAPWKHPRQNIVPSEVGDDAIRRLPWPGMEKVKIALHGDGLLYPLFHFSI